MSVAGCVIGAARIVSVRRPGAAEADPWAGFPEAAEYLWVVEQVVVLPQPRAHSGQLRVWWLDADITRADYERMVARAVELVRAGDIIQANIAQRFSARWTGSPRAVMRAALQAATPRYGAYLETPTHALVGMSPELFLDVDRRAGTAVTRPIKGTRAFHEDPAELMASAKEAAELHMIVDLMRNDLGRIAVAGGVRVDASRALESHATVHHCVAEISARLRPGITATEILRATFPPGSVTGAPKVRAMQVIDELEPCARGP
jgi:anthranilate/para-aminobenzoate synthase component I